MARAVKFTFSGQVVHWAGDVRLLKFVYVPAGHGSEFGRAFPPLQ